MDSKYSVILGNLGNTCDRFLSTGYKDNVSRESMVEQAAGIKELSGVELVGNWDIDPENVKMMREWLEEKELKCVSIIPDLFSRKKWGKGSFSSSNPATREAAVSEVKKMADVAEEMDCGLLNVWPGQDGYDYPLCADYREERLWLIEGIKACAEYASEKNLRIALEYKLKEPRTHSYLRNVYDAILIVKEIDMENLGVCIDTGHAFQAYENVGESIALLKMSGEKLFHMHFNDNYGSWDDDMIAGSIHLVEYFEMLFWLKKTGYEQWYSMDQYPYREAGCDAVRSSILFIMKLREILERAGMERIEKLLSLRDPVKTSVFVREYLLAS